MGTGRLDQDREQHSKRMHRLAVAFQGAARKTFDSQTVIIWIASSVLAAFAGPFGTYQATALWQMIAVWLVLLAAAIFAAYLVAELLTVFWEGASERELVLGFMVAGSVAVGAVVHILLAVWLVPDAGARPSLIEIIFYALGVICVVLLVRMIKPTNEVLRDEAGSVPHLEEAEAPLPAHSRLAQRLDIPPGARIIAISADGHFVEVHTCSSVARIRMRFSDAVAELDGTVGLTVHRSHWVHRESIRGWVPDARKPYVVMHNDMTIPVSKTYFDKVKEAGLPELHQTQDA